jgi:hypothetical protein
VNARKFDQNDEKKYPPNLSSNIQRKPHTEAQREEKEADFP